MILLGDSDSSSECEKYCLTEPLLLRSENLKFPASTIQKSGNTSKSSIACFSTP